jgi:Arc/MetJ-type ribon-helix-helix transcriptional regulator
MPTTVTLSPELAKFVDDLVQSGKFATHEEAVNDALMRRKEGLSGYEQSSSQLLRLLITANTSSLRLKTSSEKDVRVLLNTKNNGARILYSLDSRRDYKEIYLYIADFRRLN